MCPLERPTGLLRKYKILLQRLFFHSAGQGIAYAGRCGSLFVFCLSDKICSQAALLGDLLLDYFAFRRFCLHIVNFLLRGQTLHGFRQFLIFNFPQFIFIDLALV